MWPFADWDWASTMVAWLLVVWAAVLLTTWYVLRNGGGPRHHIR